MPPRFCYLPVKDWVLNSSGFLKYLAITPTNVSSFLPALLNSNHEEQRLPIGLSGRMCQVSFTIWMAPNLGDVNLGYTMYLIAEEVST